MIDRIKIEARIFVEIDSSRGLGSELSEPEGWLGVGK
jgi:hypothetical protein